METYEVRPVVLTGVCLSAEWTDEDGAFPTAPASDR